MSTSTLGWESRSDGNKNKKSVNHPCFGLTRPETITYRTSRTTNKGRVVMVVVVVVVALVVEEQQ